MAFIPWAVLSEKILFENSYVQVRQQQVRLPRGQTYEYTLVDRPAQGVGVLLFDDSERLLLEREYRHAVGEVIWQIPGGFIDESESPIESARRELREETGYEAGEWIELSHFYDNPGLSNATSYLFLARSPRKVAGPDWDHAEEIEMEWVSLAWIREAVARGEIVDRVVLSGLAMLWGRGLI